MHLLTLCALGVVVFAATNMDDALLLIGFFSDPAYGRPQIICGQFAGIAILYAVSCLVACGALLVPPSYLGLAGIFPILIGAIRLHEQWTGRPQETAPARSDRLSQFGGVTLVTIANGGDNIATYAPLFALHSTKAIAIFGMVFTGMTAAWCGLAAWLVSRPALAGLFRRTASYLLPYLLIGLGVLILGRMVGSS